jgi:hypothetical protein
MRCVREAKDDESEGGGGGIGGHGEYGGGGGSRKKSRTRDMAGRASRIGYAEHVQHVWHNHRWRNVPDGSGEGEGYEAVLHPSGPRRLYDSERLIGC